MGETLSTEESRTNINKGTKEQILRLPSLEVFSHQCVWSCLRRPKQCMFYLQASLQLPTSAAYWETLSPSFDWWHSRMAQGLITKQLIYSHWYSFCLHLWAFERNILNEQQGFKVVSASHSNRELFSLLKKERKMARKKMKVIHVGFLPFVGKWL